MSIQPIGASRGIDVRPGLWSRQFLLLTAGNGLFFCAFFFLIPVLPVFITDLGGSESDVGLIAGVASVAAVAARLFGGAAVDRWGPVPFMTLGSFAATAGTLLLTATDSVGMVTLSRALQGVALGVFTTAAGVLAAGIVPQERRAEGFGWFGLSGNFAMALGPVIAAAVMVGGGYESVFWTSAAVGALAILLSRTLGKEGAPAPGDESLASLRPPAHWIQVSRGALEPSLVIMTAAYGFGGIMTFAPLRGEQLGMANLGLVYTVLALTQVVTRIGTGRLSDRFGRGAVVLPSVVVTAVGLALMGLWGAPVGLLFAALCAGLGWGALMPALLALAVDRAGPRERGAAMGTFFSAADLGVALGTGTLGIVIERVSFEAAFVLAAAVALGGVAAVARRM